MANGKIRFGKQSGGTLGLVFPDGATNTEVTLPESGTLAKTSDINTAGVELKIIATGAATFTATTNNINLTGIGIGVEIGDVIQISGAEDTKNNSEFTVEVITDNNNIIVNQAHSNKGTSKNVATRASDMVTVKLLAKWYNAPIGLGQGWVNVTASRILGVTYPNSTGKPISVSVVSTASDGFFNLVIDGSIINFDGISNSDYSFQMCVTGIVPNNSTYSVTSSGAGINSWYELR